MIEGKAPRFWILMGGRKQFNGYLAVALITGMSFRLHVTFLEYVGSVLVALGVTSSLVALEEKLGTPAKEEKTDGLVA
jgi:hypothetical protein